QQIGAGGEIQLTDAIQMLNEIQNVYAYDFEGKRYDVGEKLGFVKTNIEFALQNDEIKEELMDFLVEMIGKRSVKA
ncbi:UTP--glucose-1-phosphate uridylyltransferase, partial [Pantoea sp. SIMBA_133]